MAVFSPEDGDHLDYQVLAAGGVSLYFQHEVLAEDLASLAIESYEIVQFDEEALDSVEGFHFEARLKLGFPESYEPTVASLRDALSKLAISESGGMALILPGIERIAAEDRNGLQEILEVIFDLSHRFLLTGRRFLALLQSDDPELDYLGDSVAESLIGWNSREAEGWTRGL